MSDNEISIFVDKLILNLADGFQISDVWRMLAQIMEHGEDLVGLSSGEDKKDFALKVLGIVLEHKEVDLPGPDWITKRVIMWLAPSVVDFAVRVAKENFNFGSPT